jgi:hypothetical protein
MLLSDFRQRFPEFQNAPDLFVQAALDAAALEIDPCAWGAKADQGQAYLAAHKMALSPYGNGVRVLVGRDPVTTYWVHYDALVRQVAHGGMMVI